MIVYGQKRKGIFMLYRIVSIFLASVLLAGCATLRLETMDESIKEENRIRIRAEHDPEWTEFTAFKITIRNNQDEPIYFSPYACNLNLNKTTFAPLSYRKTDRQEKEDKHWSDEVEGKDWLDNISDFLFGLPAPPDYYLGDVPLYSYEMERIKPLFFEEGFILPEEEKSGYIFFPSFKEGERLRLKIPIKGVNFDFTYKVKN